jgi:hypothetical protein
MRRSISGHRDSEQGFRSSPSAGVVFVAGRVSAAWFSTGDEGVVFIRIMVQSRLFEDRIFTMATRMRPR